jgi:hypothetical protein
MERDHVGHAIHPKPDWYNECSPTGDLVHVEHRMRRGRGLHRQFLHHHAGGNMERGNLGSSADAQPVRRDNHLPSDRDLMCVNYRLHRHRLREHQRWHCDPGRSMERRELGDSAHSESGRSDAVLPQWCLLPLSQCVCSRRLHQQFQYGGARGTTLITRGIPESDYATPERVSFGTSPERLPRIASLPTVGQVMGPRYTGMALSSYSRLEPAVEECTRG